ncbi:MAG: iron-sulfur cluster assembly accessory protein [Pseudomonadota bacterium]
MAITLTESAAERVISHLKSRNQGEAGLRVAVKNSGCSGLAYVLDYADEASDDDQVFESNGVTVFVNPEHLEYLQGLQIDYVQNGLSSAFHFNNPNVTEECGCGESFTVN